jgi:hypothetical protein
LEVDENKVQTITALLDVRSESLGLELLELTFLTDREGEFEEHSAHVRDHVKIVAYRPEANGEVERRHKEISMLCRLYDCDLLLQRCGTLVRMEFFKIRLLLRLVH